MPEPELYKDSIHTGQEQHSMLGTVGRGFGHKSEEGTCMWERVVAKLGVMWKINQKHNCLQHCDQTVLPLTYFP